MLFLVIENKHEHALIDDLYNSHKNIMLYTAKSILKDQYLAEDAVHQAFVRLFNHLNKISDTTCNKTRSFLVIIVKNIAINIYNKRKREISSFQDEFETENILDNLNVENLIISDESYDEMINCISKLDSKFSDVILLKYCYDYTNDEIARLLNISNENVRIRIHRGKAQLLKLIMREGEQIG
jgi:RNA polymerase sigma-70 factor (ECF subfamily)